MFLNCCHDVYQFILKMQIQFLDSKIILRIKLQDDFEAILKKDYLHIYKNDEPLHSLLICYPNIINWKFSKGNFVGFVINNQTYFSDQTYRIKEILNGRLFFSKISDFYIPLQILGKGSTAKVLLIKQKGSDVYFAAKCVPKSESIVQEIEINNQLDHCAFIKIKEVFLGETSYYIIMDLLSGKNLQQLIKNQHHGLTVDQCKLIMHALLSGIEYMHSKNIMHRDIKLENIVLEQSNNFTTLKIVDFGLATYSNLKIFKYPKCGTPGYVAPEIANLLDKTQIYDKKCDIFSAGAVFYKLLTGRELFPGTGFNFVLSQNKKCQIDYSILNFRRLPQSAINLLQQMLQKDPLLRLTATDCLKHPFFTQNKENQSEVRHTRHSSTSQPETIESQNESPQEIQSDTIVQGNQHHQRSAPSNAHKKQFFAQTKQVMQTVDFFSEEKNEYKGSFITNDMVHFPQMPKMVMKFNTTEFEQE